MARKVGRAIPLERRTLGAVLERNANDAPDRPFLVDSDGSVDNAGTLYMAAGAARILRAAGVARGDRVVIAVDKARELVATWFGCAMLGAVEVPVNPTDPLDRLIHIMQHCEASAVVADADLASVIAAAARHVGARILIVGRDICADPSDQPGFISTAAPGDPVAIMYTSGTTGPPKGVVLSHAHHVVNGLQPVEVLGLSADDRWHLCLPLFHNMAQGYAVWPALAAGGSVYLAGKFDATTFWAEAERGQSTVWPFIGAMLVLLHERTPEGSCPAHAIRTAYGVPVPEWLHRRFEQRFGLRVVHCYGSTEATIVCWDGDEPRTPGSVGRPIAGYEVSVRDAMDRELPPGEIGQICTRAHEPFSMFSGYWGEPERPLGTVRNLWFHTGDEGLFDPQGRLWFAGRSGDVIRRMGETIACEELESVLLAHPDLAGAAAFGVPSLLTDEEVMVAVVARPGTAPTPGQLRGWCAARLPRYAVPRFVEFVDQLPLTATGKLQRFKLKKRGVTSATDDARAPDLI